MCGIYGILKLDGSPVAPEALGPMARLTEHRGPDDQGSHIDRSCALGMRRLSIIDVAGGHQPLFNEDGTIAVVANGEIYNYRELRRDLERRGHRFRTASDCETIVHLYEEHGEDFVSRLNGMFALAIWDARRQRLLLARDRMGIKPLYVARDHTRLAFASEAKAIVALPGFRRAIDPLSLRSYLSLGYVAAPRSMFEGVRKLPPATLLIAQSGTTSEKRFWQPPRSVNRARTAEQWIADTRDALERAVHMQMVSDVPIGAFLSGGIDSSAVVAFMATHSAQPVKTYSIGFEGGAAESFYNELPYAKQVAQRFGTEHHEIVVRPDVVSLLPNLVWHLDEPIADTAFITTYLVSEYARRDVTVILSGVGGDELFGGYRRYLGNHYGARFDRLPEWLRRAAIAFGERLPSDRHSPVLNALRLAKGFLASAGLSLDERYRSYMQVCSPAEVESLLLDGNLPDWDPLSDAFALAAGDDDDIQRMLVVDMDTQLPDDLLLLTDRMSMAVSLECRVPLLEQELVDLAASMPGTVKMQGGRLKHVMKEALRGVLPPEILHRKKRGFGTPMGAWLKGDLAPLLCQLLSREAVKARGLFRHEPIAHMISAHRANRIDGTDALLSLLNLEIWSRIYLDQRSPSDVMDELKAAA